MQLLFQRRARQHAIDQVGPIERADELDRIVEAELRRDVAPHARRRGRRVGVQADAGEQLAQPPELAVLGPEVVPPLADAVRFVHGDEADVDGRQQRQKRVGALADQPLGRDVEQLVAPLTKPGDDVGLLRRRERAVEQRGRHAVADERVDLVLHQRDQRRDDDREARADDGRRLKAERLAAAGRQDDDRIAAGEHRVHRLSLQRPERRVAPVLGNGLLRGRGRSCRTTLCIMRDETPMTDHDVAEVQQAEKLLSDLRRALLRLHKTLLDWERAGYERIHGRQSSNDLLNALLNDPQFAWLRPISQLIVRIDELLGDKTPPMRNDVDAVVVAGEGADVAERRREHLRAPLRHGAAGTSGRGLRAP